MPRLSECSCEGALLVNTRDPESRTGARSRPGLPKRGISTTRPGTLLKHQVAIKTFADWTESVPGFVEVDLVAHCGWTGAGPFLYTLTVVDVATGWVRCAGLRDKRPQTVLAAPPTARRPAVQDSGTGQRQWQRVPECIVGGVLCRPTYHLHPRSSLPQERQLFRRADPSLSSGQRSVARPACLPLVHPRPAFRPTRVLHQSET
jgi:hypothetical protein